VFGFISKENLYALIFLQATHFVFNALIFVQFVEFIDLVFWQNNALLKEMSKL
jgi:hypothetical protein